MTKNVHMCVAESLFCRAEIKHNIVTQLYFNQIKILKNSVFDLCKSLEFPSPHFYHPFLCSRASGLLSQIPASVLLQASLGRI